MHSPAPESVTQLLEQWRGGDQEALERLIPLVYRELQRIAHRQLRNERDGHTLQTTALVNEAYLRLANRGDTEWQNRAHFLGVAAGLMRQILVDYARYIGAKKRGVRCCISLEEGPAAVPAQSEDLIALDTALARLASVDPRKARVVELRYFGGLNVGDAAEVLGVRPNTVIRDWRLAKVWLKRELTVRRRYAT